MGDALENRGAEARGSRRTNLLLSATAEFGGLSSPIRIRNVSETGAMLEGAHLPGKGARLWVIRTGIKVAATVAWASNGKVGVQFDEPVPVERWGGGKPRPIDLSGLRDQRRVDAIQQAVRAGQPLPSCDSAAPTDCDAPGQLNARIAEELDYVSRLIESLGDQLAADPAILMKHSKVLQNMDLGNQILKHLAAIVAAEDPATEVATVGMSDLRARLTRRTLAQSFS
jgi:hypothetical protein